MNEDKILKEVKKIGFEHFGILDIKTIELLPEIREMCNVNTCGMYNKNWSCPPGCGTLEDCKATVSKYTTGIIIQTVDKLDNCFDYDGMMEIEDKHKKRSLRLRESLAKSNEDILFLGVGACTICEECTYPDKPCRFPEKMISSLESFGIFVTQLCKDNGLGYYYGPNTISYTSCLLFRNE